MYALQTDISLWQVGLQNFFGYHSLFVALLVVFFFFLTLVTYARLNYWKRFRVSNCTLKVCWPIFGLCSFQDSVINFQLIMDQNDFMNCEVSSNIRCDQICRVSHFCTRHFHLTPTSCCCSLVVSVPTAALGEGKGSEMPQSHPGAQHGFLCHPAMQLLSCSSAWDAALQPGQAEAPGFIPAVCQALC